MTRCVLNVATGYYVVGQKRLMAALGGADSKLFWTNVMPPESPPHSSVPYAFKAHAIAEAQQRGFDLVLWADASIVPIRGLEPLWERIERDGYWFSKNGYWNSEWTTKAAYPLLDVTEEENKTIPHVVATAFGLNLRSMIGQDFAEGYLRFAENGAFIGPWRGGIGVQHRHDQTGASVLAHRLGMRLTDPPNIFAYRGGEVDSTILVADGRY